MAIAEQMADVEDSFLASNSIAVSRLATRPFVRRIGRRVKTAMPCGASRLSDAGPPNPTTRRRTVTGWMQSTDGVSAKSLVVQRLLSSPGYG